MDASPVLSRVTADDAEPVVRDRELFGMPGDRDHRAAAVERLLHDLAPGQPVRTKHHYAFPVRTATGRELLLAHRAHPRAQAGWRGSQANGWPIDSPKPGVNPIQYGVLAHLAASNSLAQAELARAGLVRPKSIAPLLDGPEQRRLITRSGDRVGGRANPVLLTNAGRALLERAHRVAHEANDLSDIGLGPKDSGELNRLLLRVTRRLTSQGVVRFTDECSSSASQARRQILWCSAALTWPVARSSSALVRASDQSSMNS